MNIFVLMMFLLIIDMKDLYKNILIQFVINNDMDILDEIDNENHE